MTGHTSQQIVIAIVLSSAVPGCGGSGGDPGSGGAGGSGASAGFTAGSSSVGAVSGSGGAPGSGGILGSGGVGPAGAGGPSTGGNAAGGTTGTSAGGTDRGGSPASSGAGGTSTQSGAAGVAGEASGGLGAAAGQGGSPAAGAQSGGAPAAGGPSTGGRPISFGTLLQPQAVVTAAQQLAQSLAEPDSAQWQAKGDQHRTYRFPETNTEEPYRLYVPTNWDGQSKLPLVMFLHGAGADENTYVDQNNKQLLELSQQHGYIFVAPLGRDGAYGNFLRLSAPFGKPEEAAKLMAQVTAQSERTNALSEQDVINVLELVLSEYPVDRTSMFLTGHSMGSGGTWYIGAKYASYWRGIAPMSGPFVQEMGYPWESLRELFFFVTEGTQTPSLEGSHAVRDWLETKGFKAEYKEVNADHGGMVRLVLPDVFDFFERSRPN